MSYILRKICFIILLLLPIACFSQKKYQLFYEKEGDLAMKNGEYSLAFDNYKLSLKFFTPPQRIYYKCGYACQMDKDYERAVAYYTKVLEKTPNTIIVDSFPLLYFNLAQVEISSGKYFESQKYLDSVMTHNKDIQILNKASHLAASIAWVLKHNKLKDHIVINNIGGNLNNFSSQSPNSIYGDSVLFFTTMTYNKMNTKKGKQILYDNIYNQIYFSTIDSLIGFSQSKPLAIKSIDQKKCNISNIFCDPQTTDLYFNICENSQNEGCKIYVSHYSEGEYQKPIALNNQINAPASNSLHPQIALIEGKKILFFSSNRKGGFGGYDIYYSILDKNTSANNLGSTINTEYDEITPFYDTETNNLYFASEGHLGFGGFDIFSSHGDISKWQKPENLLQPINSPANETHYIPTHYNKGDIRFTSLFSSNREGGYTKENKTCCNDIYLAIDNTPPPIYLTIIDTINIAKCYFSNDMPEDSLTSYFDCYEKYLVLKEDYKAQNKESDSLFSSLIEKGKEEIDSLLASILPFLQQGNKITLTLNGYTSALHTEEYNLYLSKLRIQSLIIYINEWNNKALAPYTNRLLKIIKNPKGKSESIPQELSTPQERQKSLFTPASISDRKVTVAATSTHTKIIQE